MDEDKKQQAGIGYPLGQLLKAIVQTGSETSKKVEEWSDVITGILNGSLKIGSRTPVAGIPPWVTPQVLLGGFVTGKLAASGPMEPHEIKKLMKIAKVENISQKETVELVRKLGRSTLNLYYLTEQGQVELKELLSSTCYRTNFAEENALLVIHWLQTHGQSEKAKELTETINPFFDRLRFYPVPSDFPMSRSSGVYLCSAGEVAKLLAEKKVQQSVMTMNQSLGVWTPLYDQMVALFLETVEGDSPSFQKDDGGNLARAASGQPVVTGGWPCRKYAADWSARGAEILDKIKVHLNKDNLCGKPLNKKSNFARLRHYLSLAVKSPQSLSGRDVGYIRKILASYVHKHGLPDSEKHKRTREMQRNLMKRPLHHVLAKILSERLKATSPDDGVTDIEKYLAPLSVPESEVAGVKELSSFPNSLAATVFRCMDAPLESLLQHKLIASAESMAPVIPLLTARIRCANIEDPELAVVVESTYRAFRKRRSFLLLNLESQVKFEELPWIQAVTQWTGTTEDTIKSAEETLKKLTLLSVRGFPQTILPNKLVREMRTLASTAELTIPMVDELAADIFMGAFAINFLRAAKLSAELLRGSLYDRYYGINYSEIVRIDEPEIETYGVKISPSFARICTERSGQSTKGRSYSAAINGMILEQSQILTTHNLAPLIAGLSLSDELKPDALNLAQKCLRWIFRTLQRQNLEWRSELQGIKNSAYAWRQMILFLSLLDRPEQTAFMSSAKELLAQQPGEFQHRFTPAIVGLEHVFGSGQFNQNGQTPEGGRQFLGWSTDRHWLRSPRS